MKLLETEFTHDSRTLRQLRRTAKVAIYELIGSQGLLYGYEVIKIRVRKETARFGTIFPEREVYPCDSQFGSMAWSFGRNNRTEAFQKFDMLVQAERESLPPNGPGAFQRVSSDCLPLQAEIMSEDVPLIIQVCQTT